jgi:hypothetical protein
MPVQPQHQLEMCWILKGGLHSPGLDCTTAAAFSGRPPAIGSFAIRKSGGVDFASPCVTDTASNSGVHHASVPM